MGLGIYLLCFLGVVLFQMAVWPVFFESFRPNLVTLVSVAAALLGGPVKGAWVGALGGAVSDLFTGYFLGMGAITNGLVGFMAGCLEPEVFKENVVVPVAVAVAATLIQQLAYWLLLLAFGRSLPFAYALHKVIGPTFIVNLIFAYPVFILVKKLEDFLGEVR